MVPTVFFDLYGTLVDIETDEARPALWRGFARYLALSGAAYAPSELRARYLALCAEETEALAAAHPALGTAGVEIELRRVFARLFAEGGVEPGAALVEDTAHLFRALSYRRPPRLIRGAARTLAVLRERGVRVCLLSNAQSCFTRAELAMTGLGGSFERIFLSSDYGCRKPSPAFFRAALAETGVSPDEALMVGNDPDTDVGGAMSVGLGSRYLHTRTSPPRRASLPEGCIEIGSLTDLLRE